MKYGPEDIGAKLNALDLWEVMAPYNWAVKPKGTAFPYFCSVVRGDGKPVKVRLLLLEGWQTLHDYIRTRIDTNFGFYSSPIEMPHFELVVMASGETKLFRHDPGYMPQEANGPGRDLACRMLWEVYGLMLRVESDRKLPLRFAADKAVFARVEGRDGQWSDCPLEIPDPPPHVEKVSFDQVDLKKARDLPVIADLQLALDFRLVPQLMTKEARPRCVYELKAVDLRTGERIMSARVSVHPESGLRGLWESMPVQVLREMIRQGKVPGEIRLVSGRVFRMLRPLCVELPFKLSLHDRIPELER